MNQMVNDLPAMQDARIRSLGEENPLEEEMATLSSILPGEFQGQRSLAGLRGHKEPDTTERLTLSLSQ